MSSRVSKSDNQGSTIKSSRNSINKRSNSVGNASNNNSSRHSVKSSSKSSPSNPRFPHKHYISASAVDLDDPIEAYDGPIDCDEVSLSSSSDDGADLSGDGGDEKSGVDGEENGAASRGDTSETKKTSQDHSSSPDKSIIQSIHEDRSSPDTIPVIYEDCYDSDYDNHQDSSTRIMNNHHPLTAPYTNDETIQSTHHDDDTLYSHEESLSIVASMSIVDDNDNGLFGRMETDESALDDEDYYRQDYFMMRRSKPNELDGGEEERASLSDRILMSKLDDRSSVDVVGMTEPELPVVDRDDDEVSQDYGDLYNDASFPTQDEEEDAAPVVTAASLEDVSDGGSDGKGCSSDKYEDLTEAHHHKVVSDPQDQIDQVSSAGKGILLPDDNEFIEESHFTGDGAAVVDKDDTQNCDAPKDDSDEEIDIGNVVVENEKHHIEEKLDVTDQQQMNDEHESNTRSDEDSVERDSEDLIDIVGERETELHDEASVVEHELETCAPSESVCATEALKREHVQSNDSLDVEQGHISQAAESDEDLDIVDDRSVTEDNVISGNHLDPETERNMLCTDEDNSIAINTGNNNDCEGSEKHNQTELESDNVAAEIISPDVVENVLPDASIENSPNANIVPSTCSLEQSEENIFDGHNSSCQEEIMVAGEEQQVETTKNDASSLNPSSFSLDSSSSPPDSLYRDDGSPAQETTECKDCNLIQQPNTLSTEISNKTIIDDVTDHSIESGKLERDGRVETGTRKSPVVHLTPPFNFEENAKLASSNSMRSNRSCETGEKDSCQEETERIVQSDDEPIKFSRSRSLSPGPRPKENNNLRNPYGISRTASLPVKWNPFPASSPHQANVPGNKSCSNVCPEPTTSDEKNRLNEGGINTSTSSIATTENVASIQSPPIDVPASIDVNKIIHENQRLRVKRQQLCESLGSMAQQFQAHENATSEKIFGESVTTTIMNSSTRLLFGRSIRG